MGYADSSQCGIKPLREDRRRELPQICVLERENGVAKLLFLYPQEGHIKLAFKCQQD